MKSCIFKFDQKLVAMRTTNGDSEVKEFCFSGVGVYESPGSA
jgi:hypothetical protein